MYEKFFHLEKPPFSTVPDPNCVHLVGQHADAVSGLVYGVMSRKGYLVLTGEAGLGKTTALGAMANLLGNGNVQLSMILNPILTAPEFIEMVMLNFGFANVPSSKAQRLKLLQEFLVRSDQEGKVSALIVDEAHKLSADLLEEIRLLGNFEAPDHKLLQIVLVGQDELDDRLNLPELWQLKQRMVVRMSLRRLEGNAVERYLKFRWNKAGGSDPMPFTGAAIVAIATWSHGIPRLINAICDNALLLAFSQTSTTVDVEHIRDACVELRLSTPATPSRPAPPARPAAASRPAPPHAPVATQGEEQFGGPQFWQYAGPSLLDKWRPLTEAEGETTKKAESPERDSRATTVTTVDDILEPAPTQFPALTPDEVLPTQKPAFTAIEQQSNYRFLKPAVLMFTGVVVLAGMTTFLLLGRRPAASDHPGLTPMGSVITSSSRMPQGRIQQSQTNKTESVSAASPGSDDLRFARTSDPPSTASGDTTLPPNVGGAAVLKNLPTIDNPPSLQANKRPVLKQVWIEDSIQAAKLIKSKPPLYPPTAILNHIQGNVRLSALIGIDGTVRNLRVIGGTPELIQSAVDAVKEWVYLPTLLNNDPVEVNTQIRVDFVLNP